MVSFNVVYNIMNSTNRNILTFGFRMIYLEISIACPLCLNKVVEKTFPQLYSMCVV